MKTIILITTIVLSACGEGIPSELSWANIDLNQDGVMENYTTSIKTQICSDCWIHAATGLVEVQYNIDHRIEEDTDLSEQNLHNCFRAKCELTGGVVRSLDHIKKYGILQEKDSPNGAWGVCENNGDFDYITIEDFSVIYNGYDSRQLQKKLLVKNLQNGPVGISIGAWAGFSIDGNKAICDHPEYGGGHYAVVVGYKDFGNTLLVKDSNGESGLLEVSFDDGEPCGFAIEGFVVMGTSKQHNIGKKFFQDVVDDDKDGVVNSLDNCPHNYNPDQANVDYDMLGDVCDPCPISVSGGKHYC